MLYSQTKAHELTIKPGLENLEEVKITVVEKGGRPWVIKIGVPYHFKEFMYCEAVARVLTGVLQKGGEFKFLLDELAQIEQPNGGYYIPQTQGQYSGSLVSHIGLAILEFFNAQRWLESDASKNDTPGVVEDDSSPTE
jgi:hypothetical protein